VNDRSALDDVGQYINGVIVEHDAHTLTRDCGFTTDRDELPAAAHSHGDVTGKTQNTFSA